MCQQDDTVTLTINGRVRDIDRCIAPLVEVLNAGGFATLACCCGHGKQPGNIALADGRELLIAPDYAFAREVEKAFPPITPWEDAA